MILNKEQQVLVENHLFVVRSVIGRSIHVNESIYGLGYKDLFQEGCICLCHAASTYQKERGKFSTYAATVIHNGLISYCRQLYKHESHFCSLSTDELEELAANGDSLAQPDPFAKKLALLEVISLLESRKDAYQGTARLGIEALELKITGMGITEIARLYHVPASHVGAWISRSAKKLRNDSRFLSGLPHYTKEKIKL